MISKAAVVAPARGAACDAPGGSVARTAQGAARVTAREAMVLDPRGGMAAVAKTVRQLQ